MSKRVHVIINPAAGQPKPILRTLNSVFRAAGVAWDVSITQAAGEARRFAQEAVRSGVDIVAIYGGDGSVMEAASGVLDSNIPLAILPGGTANAMAAELTIPGSLEDACRLISDEHSTIRAIDMGKAGEHYFALRIEVGFGAEQVRGASRALKDSLGVLAYWLSSLHALKTTKISDYHLELDGVQVESEGLACLIANSGNLGLPGVSMAADIDISDGLLDVLVIRNADLESLLSVAGSVADIKGKNLTLPHWKAQHIVLAADPPQAVQGDGELWGETPLTVETIAQRVRVIVPAEAAKSRFPKLPSKNG